MCSLVFLHRHNKIIVFLSSEREKQQDKDIDHDAIAHRLQQDVVS